MRGSPQFVDPRRKRVGVVGAPWHPEQLRLRGRTDIEAAAGVAAAATGAKIFN